MSGWERLNWAYLPSFPFNPLPPRAAKTYILFLFKAMRGLNVIDQDTCTGIVPKQANNVNLTMLLRTTKTSVITYAIRKAMQNAISPERLYSYSLVCLEHPTVRKPDVS